MLQTPAVAGTGQPALDTFMEEKMNIKMQKKISWAAGMLLLLSMIAGCTPAQQAAEAQATLDLAALKAEIASTVMAELTVQAPQAITAPAELPAAEQPTQTPWVITATTDPTQAVVLSLLPTATATRKPVSGGAAWPTITPTYYTDAAKLSSMSPASYTVFTPAYDFDTKWTIQNTGHRQWNTKFYYKFKRFDGAEFGPYFLPALEVRDTFTAILDTIAPSEPGNYYNTIYVINDDGVTFFSNTFIFTVK